MEQKFGGIIKFAQNAVTAANVGYLQTKIKCLFQVHHELGRNLKFDEIAYNGISVRVNTRH